MSDKSKQITLTSPFMNFVNRDELIQDIEKLPKRRQVIEELRKKSENIINCIVDAYVSAARNATKDIPAAYCLMAEYLCIQNGNAENNVLKRIEGMAPALNLSNVRVKTPSGEEVLCNYEIGRNSAYLDGETKNVLTIQATNSKILYSFSELTREIHEIEVCYVMHQRLNIGIPASFSEEEIEEVKAIAQKHFDKAEKEARAWLGEINQYADPSGLFASMI